jgi:hypothetical protein
MTERKKFVIMLILLLASIALVIFVRSNFSQDFVQDL